MFNDSCGGAIWTDDFNVIGQLGFMIKDEPVAYDPSFSPFMELDYGLLE